jgi:ribonuclease HI
MSKRSRKLAKRERQIRELESLQLAKDQQISAPEIWAKNLATPFVWRGYFDGATGPLNPGQSGFGAVLYKNDIEVACTSKRIGHATNNEAEYSGLIGLLELAIKHGVDELLICGDSQLVILQVMGKWKVKSAHLFPLRDKAWHLLTKIQRPAFGWIPREKNTRADQLSKIGVPEFVKYQRNLEGNAGAVVEARSLLALILETPSIISRGNETKFIISMKTQLDQSVTFASIKQLTWLRDICKRIRPEESAIDIARQVGERERGGGKTEPRLIKRGETILSPRAVQPKPFELTRHIFCPVCQRRLEIAKGRIVKHGKDRDCPGGGKLISELPFASQSIESAAGRFNSFRRSKS